MIDMASPSTRESCHQPQHSTGSGDSKKMLASQTLYAEDAIFNPWTSWTSDWTDQQLQYYLPTPSPDEAKATSKRPRQVSRRPLKALCASNTPSKTLRTIVAAAHPFAPPVRSVSWSANVETYNTVATAPTTNVPASFALQHPAPAVHSEPLAYGYNFGPVAAHNVAAFPESHQYEHSTPWMYNQSAVSGGNSHAVWSNDGQPQHPKTVHFGDAGDSESSTSSFSKSPTYPSQLDCTLQQKPDQDTAYPKKPTYGLFANFDSWQHHKKQLCIENPLNQPVPSESPCHVEPIRSRKRKSSDSQNGGPKHRTFRCEYCDFAFDRKCNLTCHLKTHGVGREDVECPQPGCGKKYGRQADANRHIRTVSRPLCKTG